MDEVFPFPPTPRDKKGTLLAARVAGQQWGAIGVAQLRDCGVARSTVSRWREDGRLHLIHSGVYALGHRSLPIEGRLVAALLHAGPGSFLSHSAAAWWWGLVDDEPGVIDLSSLARSRSCSDVVIHRRRQLQTTRHRGFPITTLAQTLLDFASRTRLFDVRRALAQADYLRLLDAAAVEAIVGQGRPGAARLRKALRRHQPRLARSRSRLEAEFLALCERAAIPLPEVNARVEGWLVDALWRDKRVVVELDGYDNHSTPAQIERDRRKELELRTAGYVVVRYTWEQVTEASEEVVTDLLSILAA